jgi:hypothetical protein
MDDPYRSALSFPQYTLVVLSHPRRCEIEGAPVRVIAEFEQLLQVY